MAISGAFFYLKPQRGKKPSGDLGLLTRRLLYRHNFQTTPSWSRNYAPAKGKVVVWVRPDGEIGIGSRIRAVRWRERTAGSTSSPGEAIRKAPNAGKRKWVPPADHPWREAARRQMERKAAGIAKRRSWALPSASP